MPLPFNAQELVAQFRQVIWMMRRGQREVTLATAFIGLFAAGTYLLTGPNLGLVPPQTASEHCLLWCGMKPTVLDQPTMRTALTCHPERRGRLARAPWSQAEHGAAWRWLVLDRCRRMGEGARRDALE
jgi:hypothetical protein